MQLRGVDTNLVIALRALLQERNVTRAAKLVGLGQSSMSHALARLRAHFGDALLVQVGRRMVLTERAKTLIEPVGEAVAKLERVFLAQERFDPTTSTRIFRIAATDNLELYVLPALLDLMAREAPGVSLRIRHLHPSWPEALANGEIDLKLGRAYALPKGLRAETLLEERVTCVVSKQHPLRGSRPTVAQYARLRHLVISPTPDQSDAVSTLVDTRLAKLGHRRTVVSTVGHFVVAPMIVARTDLALTASERLVEPFVKSLRLRRLELPFRLAPYRLSQVWADRSHDDPGHAWLRAAVVRALGSQPRLARSTSTASTPSMPRVPTID